ncbi:aurora/IPL1-related protein kinase 2-like [Selaginella moellendorffii]|uniref:aurora/IPL1-related protein kinase 2-like n=1 Tax=Selaginella moellendorffii TaxID=88036 RepID=UPI000D1C828E|nr:aurora/IPL1-related protein kinase 2-like [Selaginella moellendorffii]|eukprot:XP_024527510.1 aurora/IPL1-related protein kinase 2-like [Selaginella moellendorffii]
MERLPMELHDLAKLRWIYLNRAPFFAWPGLLVAAVRAMRIRTRTRAEAVEMEREKKRRKLVHQGDVETLGKGGDAIKPSALERRYELGSLLGCGRGGVVFKATRRGDGQEFAIKTVSGGSSKEALLMLKAGDRVNDGVIKVKELHYDAKSGEGGNPKTHIVMELCACNLDLGVKFAEPTTARIFFTVAKGLREIHRNGVIHCDIKPANILLTRELDAKLADFGLACDAHKPWEMDFVGTPGFMAPEVMFDGIYTPAVDVWSLGMTLRYALLGKLRHLSSDADATPFVDVMKEMVEKRETYFLDCDEIELANMSIEVIDLLHRMLAFDPEERITLDEGRVSKVES